MGLRQQDGSLFALPVEQVCGACPLPRTGGAISVWLPVLWGLQHWMPQKKKEEKKKKERKQALQWEQPGNNMLQSFQVTKTLFRILSRFQSNFETDSIGFIHNRFPSSLTLLL